MLTAAAIIVTVGTLQAHDFWLIPDFNARAGRAFTIVAHRGDGFPVGDTAVATDRIVRFEVLGSSGAVGVAKLTSLATATEGEVMLKQAGTHVVAIALKPRPIELSAEDFQEYLSHEGLVQVLKSREEAKTDDEPGKELYAKYAKSILHLGAAAGDSATTPVGLKLEIVPQRDPASLKPGEKLALQVLFDSKPLGNVQVGIVSDTVPGIATDEGEPYFTTRTNYEGIATVPISNPGTWLVRLVHMVPAQEGKPHDWESFFSTLTFRIPPEKGFPLTVDSIMRGSELVGSGISDLRWAGDSSRLYFGWQKPGEKSRHTYVIARGGGTPKKLSDAEAKLVPPARGDYTKDRKRVVFTENGDIVIQDTVTHERILPMRTTATESGPRFTGDEKHITFVRANNLFRLSLESSRVVQLTDFRRGPQRQDPKLTESQEFLENQQRELFEVLRERAKNRKEAEAARRERETRKPYYYPRQARISGLILSPDQSRVAFSQIIPAAQAKRTIVPNYVTESGYTEDIPARTKVGDAQGTSRMGLVTVENGSVVWIDHGQKDRTIGLSNPLWSDDGKHLVVTGVSQDYEDRYFYLVDQETGTTKIIDHLHDDAWVMSRRFGGSLGWMPGNESIYFISEKSGYFQLYTAASDGSGARALTSGKFEVFSPDLSQDEKDFYFTSSEAHPGERHFYRMSAGGGERMQITSMAGNNRVTLSPDERTLAIIHSYTNKPPELYLMENQSGGEARSITLTPTEEWRSFPWVDPDVITFEARDGAEVYARVYTPEMLRSARGDEERRSGGSGRPPGVIFVHGAGYTQNAHRWWSGYYREYMFHHILMDRGYVVMDIDYRASAGYGRDWRTAIYRHMGGQDLEDQVDGARWMVENLDVDPDRIGIYGGSYGGFITLMAMFTTPDVFAAGASLRPVTDWAHYNHPYTANILNEPQEDQEAYKRSSPIYFAEGLTGALLICHGVVDTNVHFEDTVRLAQRLIELRKENWEVAMYPVEGHGFRRADSWTDEYKRILKLFETHLKK
jgi:dipeptidyl aminopeptidase/acylaminoacyl peptidase